jgi:uncharacterized cupredoxin-like copper-binding protein
MRIRSVGAVLAAMALALAYGTVGNGETAAASATPTAAPSAPTDAEPPATPGAVERRIDVGMQDHEFSPTTLDVKLGETVTFVFTNHGLVIHDAFLGDKAAQDQHEKEMREADEAGGGGGHDHAHEGGVTVAPGQTGALRHRFDRPGTLEIGCHQEGHYEEGMKILLNVNII